jgi:hypothetical protein
MLDTIWKEGDSIHVALFKVLLYYRCGRAALGLLDDMLAPLLQQEQEPRPDAEPQRHATVRVEDPTAGETRDKRVPLRSARQLYDESKARLREDAKVILGDNDGTKLREWLALYATDRAAWEEEALDWFEYCYDRDLFGFNRPSSGK